MSQPGMGATQPATEEIQQMVDGVSYYKVA